MKGGGVVHRASVRRFAVESRQLLGPISKTIGSDSPDCAVTTRVPEYLGTLALTLKCTATMTMENGYLGIK